MWFLVIGGALLLVVGLLSSKLVALDLENKNIQTGIEVVGLRFTSCIPISGEIEIRLNKYKRMIWGASLPINVPLTQIQLLKGGKKVMVIDESSKSKEMEELAERLTELLDGMMKNK